MMKQIIFAMLLMPVCVFAQVTPQAKNKPKAHKAHTKAKPGGNVDTTNAILPAAPYNPGIAAVQAAPQGEVVQHVDQLPEFTGGQQAWVGFLRGNLDATGVSEEQDSTSYAQYGTTQSVQVQFVVCQDGSLCNIDVANRGQVSNAAAQEAIRVMKKSPVWKPGMLNGKPVKAKYIQRITFQFID